MNVSHSTAPEVTGTAKEFASKWGTDYTNAVGFIKFLESKGQATKAGKQKTPSGKGKPSDVYSIHSELTISLNG